MQGLEHIGSRLGFLSFKERERESSFSLDLRSFGPSVLFRARSKVHSCHGRVSGINKICIPKFLLLP